MAYTQGNIIDPATGNRVIPNTSTAAVADIDRNNQALNESLASLVEKEALGYPAFSTDTAQAVGDIVFYDRKLYKFTSAHAAGAWNASEVEEYSIKDLVDDTCVEATEANVRAIVKNWITEQ